MRCKYLIILALIYCLVFAQQLVLAANNTIIPNNISINPPELNLYGVKRERHTLRTKSGTTRSFILYTPQKGAKLPGPPYPVLVIIHGFIMSSNQQQNNSRFLAERGFVVLSPNISRLLWGDKNRMCNISDILDEVTWLTNQSKTPSSPLYGMIDPNRLAVAGNSSGGAVCFELLIEGQKANIPIKAMCSLEGVPWDRTLSRVSQLKPVDILSLRAEPSLCNYHANVLQYLKLLKFPSSDVKINGAAHCDAENPTAIGCMCICGKSSLKYRLLFQHLMYVYLRDSLGAPRMSNPQKSFTEVVQEFQNDGTVVAHLNCLPPTKISSRQ